MGVTGLWRLLEPAGKPVPVETLENKVIAVDISIWLHQMVKGYQDTKGAPLPNAHLIGLFQRVCKLLYFRIKPVFVFDGGFPDLKKETIAKRQHSKLKYNTESERLKRELALLLSKKTALSSLIGKDISPKKGVTSNESNDDDLFKLPALPEQKEESESESDDEDTSSGSIVDLHSVDIESEKFKNLPVKEKYDLLIELKETRKMNSWGKIHELPKKSDNFSEFQLQRLLKRRKVQECLEETEKEIGDGGMSIVELESLLNEEGIDTKIDSLPTRRIASDKTTRFLLINDMKQALEQAKNKEVCNNPNISEKTEDKRETKQKNTELEDDLEKAIKMSLECDDDHDKSNYTSKTDDSWTSVITDSDYTEGTDSEDEDGFQYSDLSSAKAYIMQYSDFTHKAIDTIVTSNNIVKHNNVQSKLDEILDDLRKEKSIIMEKIELSSDEESNKKDHNVVEIDITHESKLESTSANDILDTSPTQSSVIYVENLTDNVLILDSSIENSTEENNVSSSFKDVNYCKINQNSLAQSMESPKTNQLNEEIKTESESSDDDFEDVPDLQNENRKTIVQLTLNMNDPCEEEDDIFADVFMKTEETSMPDVIKCNIKSNEQFSNKGNNINESESKDVTEFTDSRKDSKEHKKEELIQIQPSTSKKNVSIINNENQSKSEVRTSDSEASTKIIEDITVNENDNNRKKISDIAVSVKNTVPVEKLNEMAEIVAHKEQELIQEKGRLDRIGRNITEQMTKEAQELLQIFGVPYIVAPMEAEAQCAFLESVNLTDGTITDDSDIWLFGGKTVYKNFFNQRKHVLQFLSERIEKSFNLTREQLVLLALLVGSDYTTGVDGIGPVTAMEILASFPYNKKRLLNETSKQGRYQQVITGLQEFKKWVKAGKRTDDTNLKKKLRNVSLTEDFPSVRVVQAYMEPNVEKSEEKFTWGELDLTILRDYTKAKFGWSQNKLDEIITPVLKRLQERRSQKTVHDYFKRKVEFQSLEEQMSKRVKAAVNKMGPDTDASEQVPINSEEPIPSKKKKVASKRTTKSTKKSVVLPGSSKICDEINLPNVTVVSSIIESKTGSDIVIPKTQRFQEIIPQREKDKQCLLQNKMKAIEMFRKTKIDRRKKATKRKAIIPKEQAELSENSDCD